MSTNSDSSAGTTQPLIRGSLNRVSSAMGKTVWEYYEYRQLLRPLHKVRPMDGKGQMAERKMYRLWPTVPSYLADYNDGYIPRAYRLVADNMLFKTPLDLWNEHYWPTVPSYVKSGDAWRLHRNMPLNRKRRPARVQSNWRNNNTYPDDIDPDDPPSDYVLIDSDDSNCSHSSMY